MEIELAVLSAGIMVLSFALLLLTIGSYRKHKNTKLLMISGLLALFFLKGTLMILSVVIDSLTWLQIPVYYAVVDIIMLLLLFIATLKRS